MDNASRRPAALQCHRLHGLGSVGHVDGPAPSRNRNQMVTAMVSYSVRAHWGLSMGKQDSIKDKSTPAGEGATGPASDADVMPKMALASVEGPQIETPDIEASPIGMG